MKLVFDLESTLIPKDPKGFPDEIHCIIAEDVDTGEVLEAGPGEIEVMVRYLMRADRLIGHKIASFDVPVLEHHYPFFKEYSGELFDTLEASRLVYASNIYERSVKFQRSAGRSDEAREAKLPSKLLMSHSLEAWGYRLGMAKMHADVDLSFFAKFSPEMLERCKSDVRINTLLYRHLLEKPADTGWDLCSEQSLLNESKVSYIVGKQEKNGVGFNEPAAQELYAELLGKKAELIKRLRSQVKGWFSPKGKPVTPKKSMVRSKDLLAKTIVTEGATYQNIEWLEFNPASSQHRGRALQLQYGWQPKDYTETGQPETSEEILADLDYPIIQDLLEYMTIDKRLGQIGDGKEAWLRHVKDGRIHGQVKVTGTRTSRASHSRPNLGQVPKVGNPYGLECRSLFGPTMPGWVLVGCDISGLELRMLAHYLAAYDGGAFAEIVLNGDVHSEFMKGNGCFIRDNSKTWIYSFLYGCGNEKSGTVILKDWRQAYEQGITQDKPPGSRHAEELGKLSREKLLGHFGALDELLKRCKEAYRRGWLRAIDGRILACKSEHGALNDLLQGGGSVVSKYAMALWWDMLIEKLGPCGVQWLNHLFVHDEWQNSSKPEIAEDMGRIMVESIEETGRRLGVRLPLTGEFKIGSNWGATH